MADRSPSADHSLSPSSAVVLGLLGAFGPQTTYDLKAIVERSIGFFWPFPTSQLYAEAKRLEAAELLTATQEETGRRRRVLALTERGRAALDAWHAEPTDRPTEIRDIGLLKLFLSVGADQESRRVEALAAEQIAMHRERLAEYEAIRSQFGPELDNAQRTVELGLAFERMAIEFWERTAETRG